METGQMSPTLGQKLEIDFIYFLLQMVEFSWMHYSIKFTLLSVLFMWWSKIFESNFDKNN